MNRSSSGSGCWYAIPAAIAAIVVFMVISSLTIIDAGNVGVVFSTSQRQVLPTPLEPGWHWRAPIGERITEYSATLQNHRMTVQKDEASGAMTGTGTAILVTSSEGQKITLDVVVQYSVIGNEAPQLYQELRGAGMDVISTQIVDQLVRSKIVGLGSQRGWEDINVNREALGAEALAQLKDEFKRRHLNLNLISVQQSYIPTALEQQIDLKIAKQQEIQQKQSELEQAKIDANKAQVAAEGQANAARAAAAGEAEAALTRAEATAKVTRLQAEAQAEANRLLQQSLSPEVLESKRLDRWNGQLPAYQFGNNAQPLVQVPAPTAP